MSMMSPTFTALAETAAPMLTRLKHAVRDQPLLRAGALRASAMLSCMSRAEPGIYPLCYHHVSAAAQANFAAQIAFLKRFGTFIDADTALRRIEAGRASQERAFVLTFDDGYLDNLEVALPVIRDQDVPAMLFLVSDWIETPPARGAAYMRGVDVERWLAAGLHIGSHSASHRQFSRLTTAEARHEFTRSAAALEALAGRPVEHFACPWGVPNRDFSPGRDPALARAAGFRTFFTTRRGRAGERADPMALPRHVLEPEWPVYQLEALMGGRAFVRA